jgi:hypothetical protein
MIQEKVRQKEVRKMSGKEEFVKRLVVLLEAERAGVMTGRALLPHADSDEEKELLQEILDGEKDSCKALGRILVNMGESGGPGVGDFADKVMALPEKTDRLNLLIKGQDWVVRKLDELLDGELEPATRATIQEVRDIHVVNIEACRKFVDK